MESIGDTEAKFFQPYRGEYKEVLEVKNYRLTLSEFWKEVQRFIRMNEGSPGTWSKFIIACTGISEEIKSIVSALERVRKAQPFYLEEDGVKINSIDAFEELVESKGQQRSTTRFLFDYLDVEYDYSAAQKKGEGLFAAEVTEHLPELGELRGSTIRDVYHRLVELFRSNMNTPISRKTLIEIIARTSRHQGILEHPIIVTTSTDISHNDIVSSKELVFGWKEFFGGDDREFPNPSIWDAYLLAELKGVKHWIENNRSEREIALQGKRRLSAALAIGAVFKAVSGFNLCFKYRGDSCSTSTAIGSDTLSTKLDWVYRKGTENVLVVIIGLSRNIEEDVMKCLSELELVNSHILSLHGVTTITSVNEAAIMAQKIKLAISDVLSAKRIACTHLFTAIPSHLAVFIGHRLNAVGLVQCYEFVSPCKYVPTCLIQT